VSCIQVATAQTEITNHYPQPGYRLTPHPPPLVVMVLVVAVVMVVVVVVVVVAVWRW
jgi:hypothetical protein